jgi:hypothetical protein
MVDQTQRLKELGRENALLRRGGIGSDAGQADPAGGCAKKLLSPARLLTCIDYIRASLRVHVSSTFSRNRLRRKTHPKIPMVLPLPAEDGRGRMRHASSTTPAPTTS